MKLSPLIFVTLFAALFAAAPGASAADVVMAESDSAAVADDYKGNEVDLFVISKLEREGAKLSKEAKDYMCQALVDSYNEVYAEGHPGLSLKKAEFFSEKEEPADAEWLGDGHDVRSETYCKTEWDCEFCVLGAVSGVRGNANDEKKLSTELLVKELGYSHHLHSQWVKSYCQRLFERPYVPTNHLRYCQIILSRPW